MICSFWRKLEVTVVRQHDEMMDHSRNCSSMVKEMTLLLLSSKYSVQMLRLHCLASMYSEQVMLVVLVWENDQDSRLKYETEFHSSKCLQSCDCSRELCHRKTSLLRSLCRRRKIHLQETIDSIKIKIQNDQWSLPERTEATATTVAYQQTTEKCQ